MNARPLPFRPATRDDVPAVVALLADDDLGRAREGGDLAPYLAAFDAMAAEPGTTLFVAEADGRIVACYQLVLISGLSLSGTRRAELVESVTVSSKTSNQLLGTTGAAVLP